MSASGQKQPLNSIQILASERLLSGYTGHSPLRTSGDSSGCFRPGPNIVNNRNCRELQALFFEFYQNYF